MRVRARLLGGFSAFAGVQAYLLRDRVLADQEVARPFYGAMLILVLSTLAVARHAVADGVAAPGLSASAAASAAVFGGGALLALVFPPAAPVIDDSDEEPELEEIAACGCVLRPCGRGC